MYALPWWMQWFQAFGVGAISILGAWIAYKQVRIAAAKLNLDLYDRRFCVFDAARHLLVSILQHGDVTQKDLDTFHVGVADAAFLFNKEIENYLEELRKRAAQLHFLNGQLQHAGEDQAKRAKYADAVAAKFMSLQDEFDTLVTKFKPFLKLGNI